MFDNIVFCYNVENRVFSEFMDLVEEIYRQMWKILIGFFQFLIIKYKIGGGMGREREIKEGIVLFLFRFQEFRGNIKDLGIIGFENNVVFYYQLF